jgi:Uma2 family endonuclease
MTSATNRVRWTTADLALFPDDGKRYEIIDGELIVTRAPRWSHQEATGRIFAALDHWCQATGLGNRGAEEPTWWRWGISLLSSLSLAPPHPRTPSDFPGRNPPAKHSGKTASPS